MQHACRFRRPLSRGIPKGSPSPCPRARTRPTSRGDQPLQGAQRGLDGRCYGGRLRFPGFKALTLDSAPNKPPHCRDATLLLPSPGTGNGTDYFAARRQWRCPNRMHDPSHHRIRRTAVTTIPRGARSAGSASRSYPVCLVHYTSTKAASLRMNHHSTSTILIVQAHFEVTDSFSRPVS